jgi:site-specific DNA-methyltransferase (adenine-specific)
MNIDLRLGDCLEVLKTIPDNSIDAVITDPPYHLTSIVKRCGKEGSAPAQFGTDGAYARSSKGFMGKEWDGGDIAFRTDVWLECFRVLKPGGHLLSFSHSRTYHRMGVAIEDAGFEIRDQIMWIYGQGFPKSLNVGKKIEGYEGWGTALKPSHEPIVLARKPLSEKTIVENVIKHGTGGINIDGSRIGFRDEADKQSAKPGSLNATGEHSMFGLKSGNELNDAGRFPANIILDEEVGKLLDEQSGISTSGKYKGEGSKSGGIWNKSTGLPAGVEYGDKGGASRFFYCPKTSKKDKNEGVINTHPTVKPTDLMRYLINLITPKGGTILDPFMGSGSTGKAAVRCNVDFIGIEKETEYMEVAKIRINYELNKKNAEK